MTAHKQTIARSELQRKVDALYSPNQTSIASMEQIKKGCEIFAQTTYRNNWQGLIEDGKEDGYVLFLSSEKASVEAALEFLDLANYAAPSFPAENYTRPLIISNFLGLEERLEYSPERYDELLVQDMPYVCWEIDKPMAEAMETFLQLRNEYLGTGTHSGIFR